MTWPRSREARESRPGSWERQAGVLPSGLQRETGPANTLTWASGLQNRERRRRFCCLKPAHVGHFVWQPQQGHVQGQGRRSPAGQVEGAGEDGEGAQKGRSAPGSRHGLCKGPAEGRPGVESSVTQKRPNSTKSTQEQGPWGHHWSRR